MERCYKVFLAAAALAASLSLTGCGLPTFVYAQCQTALMGTMTDAQIDGLNIVQNACGSTFKTVVHINQCTAEGVRILNQAKGNTMTTFRDQCAEYVKNTVCVEGSKCYNHDDKITESMAQPAVNNYVSTNQDALTVRMKAELDAKIVSIIDQSYKTQFSNRAVPTIVQAQCANEIENQLSNFPTIAVDTIRRVIDACGNSPSSRQCQDAGLLHMQDLERNLKRTFKMECAKAALASACPSGSACGLETSEANTEQTGQAAVNFMWSRFNSWVKTYQSRLMQAASNYRPGYARLFAQFALPEQGSSLFAFVSVAAVVGGIGCVVAVARFARKRTTHVDAAEARVLIEVEEDLEE